MEVIGRRLESPLEPPAATNDDRWPSKGTRDSAFTHVVDAELSDLLHLSPNWDGYGAPKIVPAIVEAARTFIRSLPESIAVRPRVVPMSSGNLQFEWHRGPKVLELEFVDAQTIRYLQWHPERNVEEEDDMRANDLAKAVELIQWFMNGI